MKSVSAALAMLLSFGGAVAAQDAPPALPYTMAGSVTLPSTDTGWDYVKFEPDSGRLFMARLKDGLTVFDVDSGRVIGTVANSIGANGPVLLPRYNRGYVAMDDGSLLSFDLHTLKVIARTPLASDGGLNSGSLDTATGRLHVITGSRAAESTWFTIDAASGKLLATTRFPFRKMDDPAADGKGSIYAPLRLDQKVLKLDSRTLKEQARWDVGCNVSKMKWLPEGRLLGACVGETPSVFLLDPANGTIISRVPIGKGLDALVIDAERGRIVSSNGEGTMTVITREGADKLKVTATVRTRVGARMMDMDHRNGRLYLVSAEATEFPAKDGVSVTRYRDDSFRVETWQPH